MVSGDFNGMNSVVEIHSRTNAIGMPIQDNYNDIKIISMNIKEIINLGSFLNNSQISTSFNSNDWNRRNIYLNGEYYYLLVEPADSNYFNGENINISKSFII